MVSVLSLVYFPSNRYMTYITSSFHIVPNALILVHVSSLKCAKFSKPNIQSYSIQSWFRNVDLEMQLHLVISSRSQQTKPCSWTTSSFWNKVKEGILGRNLVNAQVRTNEKIVIFSKPKPWKHKNIPKFLLNQLPILPIKKWDTLKSWRTISIRVLIAQSYACIFSSKSHWLQWGLCQESLYRIEAHISWFSHLFVYPKVIFSGFMQDSCCKFTILAIIIKVNIL